MPQHVSAESRGRRETPRIDATQESLLGQLEHAWNAGHPGRVAGCFTNGGRCEWRGVAPFPQAAAAWPRIDGREEIARCAERLMDLASGMVLAFSAVSYGSDRRIWAEWRLTSPAGSGGDVAVGVAVFSLAVDGFTEACLYGDAPVLRSRNVPSVPANPGRPRRRRWFPHRRE